MVGVIKKFGYKIRGSGEDRCDSGVEAHNHDVDSEEVHEVHEGDMAITLTSAQTFYFISGYADQCSQGLRLVVNVLDAPTTNINNNNINNNNNNIPTSPVIFLPPPHTTTYVPNFAHSSSINSIFAPLVVLVMAFVFGFVA